MIDCQWFSANLEAFFCETLGTGDFQLASEHLKTCLKCRAEVQNLHNVDPVIRQLLEYRMAKARGAAVAPKRRFGFRPGVAAESLALAAVLLFAFLVHEIKAPQVPAPAVQTALSGADSLQPPEGKTDSAAPTVRAKPDAPELNRPATPPAAEAEIPGNAPEFQVIDPSGYSKDLQDYRGRILLFGVWSADQPEAAQNLQHLYQAFGTRNEVRILGVSSRNQNRMAGTTFPMVFNNGSRLLEARNASYVLIDKAGNVQLRGSLIGESNALISKIKAKLDELAGR